jgi:hypothetical protein
MVRWSLDGNDQGLGDDTIEFSIETDTTATVHYTVPDEVAVSVADQEARENTADPAALRFYRTGTTGDLRLFYEVGGTAAPSDYEESLSGQITIPDGNSSVTLSVTPLPDARVEGDETVVVSLVDGPGYVPVIPTDGTLTVLDRDGAGDFDGDGRLEADDLRTLYEGWGTGESQYDLSADGSVGPADVDLWVRELVGTVAGDVDLDYDVDFSDATAVMAYYTGPDGTGMTWLEGDFDLDGDVDFSDFTALAGNYGR